VSPARVRVEPAERIAVPLTPGTEAELKTAFLQYSRTNSDCRNSIRSADFEAERITHIKDGTKLTSCLIHHIPMSTEQRVQLLTLSDEERALQLLNLPIGRSGAM
jgi:hypothetical protein